VPRFEWTGSELLPGERKEIDCVEIYLPKSIEFLSELYQLLRDMVTNRLGAIVANGFSIYEVDGVFYGERLWEQRSLVIRLLLPKGLSRKGQAVEWRVALLGQALATRVAVKEEEIWICHYPQTLTIFRGAKRLLK
jgi:hypothetical protein